jgi:hypothetical protein
MFADDASRSFLNSFADRLSHFSAGFSRSNVFPLLESILHVFVAPRYNEVCNFRVYNSNRIPRLYAVTSRTAPLPKLHGVSW